MSAKYTAGPWHQMKEVIYSDEQTIAHCTLFNSEANANLIASAPELKFYLEDLIEQIKQFPQVAKGINIALAEKAIAKSDGR